MEVLTRAGSPDFPASLQNLSIRLVYIFCALSTSGLEALLPSALYRCALLYTLLIVRRVAGIAARRRWVSASGQTSCSVSELRLLRRSGSLSRAERDTPRSHDSSHGTQRRRLL